MPRRPSRSPRGDTETDTTAGYAYDTADRVKLTEVANINTLSALPTSGSYKITDADGLMKLASLVNSATSTTPFKGVTIYYGRRNKGGLYRRREASGRISFRFGD